ncbi:MAG TPA: F0F1 ATP synthase subunit delta [Methanothrix soehngenii]|nr:F0F1 ATP synthase subunit delta [Methanothrix soehngenii]
MQIDYFTTVAQVVNFALLVFLLKHFLYRPLLNLMEEREAAIVISQKAAESARREAQAEAESYRKKKEELSAVHEELLVKAKEEAKEFKADLMKKTRDEIEETRVEWLRNLQRQKGEFVRDLRRYSGQELYAISRRALQELADEDLEKQIINVFINRLSNLEEHERDTVEEFLRYPEQLITVRSAYEIPREYQTKIRGSLAEQVGFDVRVQFEVEKDLICGIVMSAKNVEIAWSIAGYLESLEDDFSRWLEKRTLTQSGVK